MNRTALAIVASLLFIGAATLFPQPEASWPQEFWCLRCPESTGLIDVALNVALFVPLGVALRLSRARAAIAISAIVATTVGVEALQYFLVVGRDGTVRDILTNCVGGIIGYASPPHLHHLVRPGPRVAGRVAWIAAVAWIGHAALAMIAFRPAATPHQYYGQWAARFGGYGVFRGTVLDATINRAPLPRSQFDVALLDQTRRQPSIELGARIVPGRTSRRPAPIVSVADDAGNEIAFLAQQGDAVGFRTRLIAHEIGLGAPSVLLGSTLPAGPDTLPGAPLTIAGSLRDWVLRVRVEDDGGERRERTLSLTPSLGWSLWWTPFVLPRASTVTGLTWLWLVVPMFAIGFWCSLRGDARESRRSIRRLLLEFSPLLAAAAVAHVAIPFLLAPGLAVPSSTVAALATGATLGIVVAFLRPAHDVNDGGADPR